MPTERLEPHKGWPAGCGGREGNGSDVSLISVLTTGLHQKRRASVPVEAKIYRISKTPQGLSYLCYGSSIEIESIVILKRKRYCNRKR